MNKKLLSFFAVGMLLFSGFSLASSLVKQNKQSCTIKELCNVSTSDEKTLSFSSSYSLNVLDIKGTLSKNAIDPLKYNQKTISFHFDYSSCTLEIVDDTYSYIAVDDLQLASSPGKPLIPMKTFTVTIPGHVEIIEAGVIDGQYVTIDNKIVPVPKPQPVFWSETMFSDKVNKLIPDLKTYTSDALFPGNLVSYDVGYDTEKTVVYLRVYPVQYMPKSNKALFISDGDIQLFYTEDDSIMVQSSDANSWTNIIIAPPAFYDEAVQLRNFHITEGTETAVVNTTWIFNNYKEADNPPFPGYDNLTRTFIIENIRDYDFSLAKKIISYLKDTSLHPELAFVTLLGTARMVPPSYYVYAGPALVPTDFFYASPDYDRVTSFKVGRLPVDTVEQASHVVEKIMNWDATTELFGNITVAGGKSFGTPYYFGEMIVVDMINQGLLRGISPTKCFRTDESFDKYNVSKALMGDTGILYHIDHGSGTAWYLGGDSLDVNDVLEFPSSNTSPIVVSIACMNGAFDTYVANMSYDISFGESLLLSNAGGIAYIGGARSNAGMPVFSLDEGYLSISDETYMARMLTDVFKPFFNGSCKLGDLTSFAISEYAKNHDFSDPTDDYTFFCFTLLGDPALTIPIRPVDREYQTPVSTVTTEETKINIDDLQIPYLTTGFMSENMVSLHPLENNVTYSFISSSPMIDTKIVDCFAIENCTTQKTRISNPGSGGMLQFIPKKGSIYAIRLSSEDGKEGWLFTAAAHMVDDDYTEQTSGLNSYRWKTVEGAVDACTDLEIIYVWNGTYYEHLELDKSLFLLGEHSEHTILDAENSGTAVNIRSDSCGISGFTIMNAGSERSDAGVIIESNASFVSNTVIKNNGNNGVSVRGNIMMPCIFLNIIENNSCGINVESDAYYGIIFENRLKNNDVGINCSRVSFQVIVGNEIASKDICLSLYDADSNMILYNNVTGANYGVFIDGSKGNTIGLNNFIDTEHDATFYRCHSNRWVQNYWGQARILPKFIIGTRGNLGLIPWLNMDPLPSEEPIPIDSLFFL